MMEMRDAAAEILKVYLDPYLPDDPELRREFEFWLPVLARVLPNANIPDYAYIDRLKDYLYDIVLWLKCGMPHVARKRLVELLMELQATRAVKGFERLAQISTRSLTEGVKAEEERRGIIKKMFGFAGGREGST